MQLTLLRSLSFTVLQSTSTRWYVPLICLLGGDVGDVGSHFTSMSAVVDVTLEESLSDSSLAEEEDCLSGGAEVEVQEAEESSDDLECFLEVSLVGTDLDGLMSAFLGLLLMLVKINNKTRIKLESDKRNATKHVHRISPPK